jgi:hypothetical protein
VLIPADAGSTIHTNDAQMHPALARTQDLSAATVLRLVGVLILLALIYGVVYLARAPVPGFYRDDWSHVQLALSGESWRTLFYTWPTDYRPLESLSWFAWTDLFGTDVARYYDTLFAICYLNAILLHLCVARLTARPAIALAAAVLWAVFPADGSVFWLSAIAYRLGMLFFLVALLVLVTPLRTAVGWRWVAIASAALSLACNEIFLGLVAALALVAARGSQAGEQRPARPYLAVTLLYLLYRLVIGPHILNMFDNHQGDFNANPLQVLSVALGSVTIVLGGWASAIGALLGGPAGAPAWEPVDESFFFGVPAQYAPLPAPLTIVLVIALLGGCGIAWRSRRYWLLRLARAYAHPITRPGLQAVAIGVIGVAAGIAPLLLTGHQPTLTGVDARVNAAATPGAALLTVGVLWLVIAALPRRRWAAQGLFYLGIGLLALIAIGHSNRVADNYTRAWDAQRQLWRQVLAAAPSFKPGTVLLLAGADPASGKAVLQLTPWGFQGALTLLYGPEIGGTVMPFWQEQPPACAATRYPGDIMLYTFAADHTYLWDHGHLILPSQRVVVLRYASRGVGSITVVRGTYPIAGSQCAIMSNPGQIVPNSATPNRWRTLMLQAR